MTRHFDQTRWEGTRADRAQRMEIAAAERQLGQEPKARIARPGKWRIERLDDGTIQTERFS